MQKKFGQGISIFNGTAKNVPPFLSAYLKPFKLVPSN
jgi:hypothetical protein